MTKTNILLMKLKQLLAFPVLLSAVCCLDVSATPVTVQLNALSTSMKFVSNESGKEVEIGTPSEENGAFEFECTPGLYTIHLFDAEDVATGSVETTVGEEALSLQIFNVSGYCSNLGWKLGEDYDIPFDKISVSQQQGGSRNVTPVIYDNGTRNVVTFPVFISDTYTIHYIPLGRYAYSHAPAIGSGTVTYNVNNNVTIAPWDVFTFTAPKDADVFVGYKIRHFIPFEEQIPVSVNEEGDNKVYTYRVPSDTYNYRVSRPGCVTVTGRFKSSDMKVTVTDEQLNAYSPDYYNHDLSFNTGLNYADIYLNINPQNHLYMDEGEDFQIVNMRTWQLTESTAGNYFMEPDFHYTVLNTSFEPDNSVVDVDEAGIVTAKAKGTAIVQVRYDAITYEAYGGNVWSSIWAENVGTFVVTVGSEVPAIKANFELPYDPADRVNEVDAEHDVFYYFEGEDGYDYTFTPEGVSKVTVANPVIDLEANTLAYPDGFSEKNVTKNADGSYTIKLAYGRNIVCLTDASGNSVYQLMSAKPMAYNVKSRYRTDKYFLPGDQVDITLEGVFHCAGKLAAVYNQGCSANFGVTPEGYSKNDGNVENWGNQYSFQVDNHCYVTLDNDQKPTEMNFADGRLLFSGWGDKMGSHRLVDYVNGRSPNFNAVTQYQEAGRIPNVGFRTSEFEDGMQLTAEMIINQKRPFISFDAVKLFLGENFEITIDDPEVLTVSEDGMFQGKKEGTAVATFSEAVNPEDPDAKLKSFTLTVNVSTIKVESIALKETDIVVKSLSTKAVSRGLSIIWNPSSPTNKKYTVEFSNPELCSLNLDLPNMFTFKVVEGGVGECDITVTTLDGDHQAVCHVTVVRGVEGIEISDESCDLPVGETLQLSAKILPEDAVETTVYWATDDPEIATVDENGLVTAVAEGEATICATSTENRDIYVYCHVKVTPKDQSGVEDVTVEGSKDAVYYNLEGVPSDRPFKGFNIIRYSDGSTKKVYIK